MLITPTENTFRAKALYCYALRKSAKLVGWCLISVFEKLLSGNWLLRST